MTYLIDGGGFHGASGLEVIRQTPERPRCPHCLDDGHVCEDHPDRPWEGIWGTVEGHREHGGIGMPCPHCCPPVPEDGSAPIAQAFVPDWKRA